MRVPIEAIFMHDTYAISFSQINGFSSTWKVGLLFLPLIKCLSSREILMILPPSSLEALCYLAFLASRPKPRSCLPREEIGCGSACT